MFRLFEDNYKFSRTTLSLPSSLYISRVAEQVILTYKNYYGDIDKYIPNSHPFMRLLEYIDLPVETPLEEVAYYTREKITVMGSIFGISSYEKKGRPISPGLFYGKNATELFFAHDERFQKHTDDALWHTYSPFKVVRHERTAIDFPYLDGKQVGPEGEVVVISVNIIMLAYQYHMWRRWHFKKSKEIPKSSTFIGNVLIPGLIDTHMDIVILNRIMNDVHGMPNDDSTQTRHPFYIVDMKGRIASFCEQTASRIAKKKLKYNEVIHSLTGIRGNLIMDTLVKPETLVTVQNRWVLFLAYAPIFNFLVMLDNQQENNMNLGERGALKYRIKTMLSESNIVDNFRGSSATAGIYVESEIEELRLNLNS